MAVTVKQIAAEAGVSHPVVSKVLYGGTSTVNVSDKRRAQILQVAEELGFTPDWRARAFREKRTRTVGLLTIDRQFTRLVSTEVVAGLVHHLGLRGYSLAFATPSGTRGWQEVIGDRRFDGCLIDYYIDAEEVEAARRSGVPVALLNTNPAEAAELRDMPLVGCDYAALGEAAARHLIDMGADRLWLAGDRLHLRDVDTPDHWYVAARIAGARRVAEATGVGLEVGVWNDLVGPVHAHAAGGGRPGVLVSDSFRSSLMLEALRGVGLRLPRDVLLVCAGSSPDPTVTYVGEPFDAMTAYAVGALMRLMRPDDEHPDPVPADDLHGVPEPGQALLLPPDPAADLRPSLTTTEALPPDVILKD